MEKTNLKLPANWVQRESKSRGGKMYFFNNKTGKSVWRIEDVLAKTNQDKSIQGNGSIISSTISNTVTF